MNQSENTKPLDEKEVEITKMDFGETFEQMALDKNEERIPVANIALKNTRDDKQGKDAGMTQGD